MWRESRAVESLADFSIVPYQQYVMCSHLTSVSLKSWARAADRRVAVLGMK